MARTSKHIFAFAFGSFFLTLSLLYLALLHIVHIHMLDIVCVCSHLCWTKRASNSTSTLNLEESRGVVPEPFTENSDSLLVTNCGLAQLSFKFCIIFSRLASAPIHPPRCISISIRASAADIQFNQLGVWSWIANLDLHCTHIVYTLMDFLAPPMYDVSNIDM